MNREIKFRAWDEGNKIMHNNFQFIKSGDEGNDWIIFISDKFPLENYQTNPFTNPNPYFSQQLKIMQFTGLLGFEGVEIYEKDLVRSKITNKVFEYGFNSGRFGVKWDGTCVPVSGKEWEVVGNVFENPELLESGE